MFGASLSRQHCQFFSTATFCVYINQYPKACLLELAQAEICDFNPGFLLLSNHNTGLAKKFRDLLLVFLEFF